jgi:hypothetical protein
MDARQRDQLQPLFERRHQQRRLPRPQQLDGMGVERQRSCPGAELRAARDHVPKHCLMADVNAIEVADGQHASAGRIVKPERVAVDLHRHLRPVPEEPDRRMAAPDR